MKLRKAILARAALTVIWIFAIEAITLAGGELVRITSPKDGQQVNGHVKVQVQTTVDDPAYLIFTVDGTRPHSTNVRPYCYDLDTATLPDGPHALGTEVYSHLGLLGQSPVVTVRVANGTAPAAAAMVQRPAATKVAPAGAAAPSDLNMSAAEPVQKTSMSPILMLGPVTAPVAAPATPAACPRGKSAPNGELCVVLDGRPLSFDVAPAIFEGRAFGALRTLMQQSGGVAAWLAPSRQAIARRSGTLLRVTVGSSAATLNRQPVELGSAVRLAKGRTMVPLRATCTPLGYTVAWVGGERTVRLCGTQPAVQIGAAFAR
jgi:hypothetical protein